MKLSESTRLKRTSPTGKTQWDHSFECHDIFLWNSFLFCNDHRSAYRLWVSSWMEICCPQICDEILDTPEVLFLWLSRGLLSSSQSLGRYLKSRSTGYILVSNYHVAFEQRCVVLWCNDAWQVLVSDQHVTVEEQLSCFCLPRHRWTAVVMFLTTTSPLKSSYPSSDALILESFCPQKLIARVMWLCDWAFLFWGDCHTGDVVPAVL